MQRYVNRANGATTINLYHLEHAFTDMRGDEPVRVINPDTSGAYWEVYSVQDIDWRSGGPEHNAVFIMTNKTHKTCTAREFLIAISHYGTLSDVMVEVPKWEGQEIAYFNVDRVDHDEHGFKIILGNWICGY